MPPLDQAVALAAAAVVPLQGYERRRVSRGVRCPVYRHGGSALGLRSRASSGRRRTCQDHAQWTC